MRITEKKRIKIDRNCKTAPVFISWINSLGGREHWLFHRVQSHILNVDGGGDFEPFQQNIETSRGQIIELEKDAQPVMIVNASVSVEDILGLKSVLHSLNVEMLMNPLTWQVNGCVWQRILPLSGSFKLYDTNETRPTIEISFKLPYIHSQEQ